VQRYLLCQDASIIPRNLLTRQVMIA
jgi:hypothetical protein